MKDHLGDDWIGVMIKRVFGGDTMSKAQFRARVEAMDRARGVKPPAWKDELEATRPKKRPYPTRAFVYFVQSGGEQGPIKIGSTSNVKGRIASLQTAHPEPLRVRLLVPGNTETELAFHRRFAEFRMSGEWFRADPALLEFIVAGGAA